MMKKITLLVSLLLLSSFANAKSQNHAYFVGMDDCMLHYQDGKAKRGDKTAYSTNGLINLKQLSQIEYNGAKEGKIELTIFLSGNEIILQDLSTKQRENIMEEFTDCND